MPADFFDAHNRHYEDAECLYVKGRLANADHLYGLAAECGLKHLMSKFGMTCNPDGSPAVSDDRKHANEIWVRYESYRGSRNAAVYGLPSNPFTDWNVSQRYDHQSSFTLGKVAPHRNGAIMVHNLINTALLYGYL